MLKDLVGDSSRHILGAPITPAEVPERFLGLMVLLLRQVWQGFRLEPALSAGPPRQISGNDEKHGRA